MILPHHGRSPDLVSPDRASDLLLTLSRRSGEALSNLKLQKLLFYAQAWYLALVDRELFREDFQAWGHGPVLPSQYHRFRNFEWRPIDLRVHRPDALPYKVQAHLKEIISVFGSETAIALEVMTHREAPWRNARRGLAPTAPSTAVITKDSMKAYYKNL